MHSLGHTQAIAAIVAHGLPRAKRVAIELYTRPDTNGRLVVEHGAFDCYSLDLDGQFQGQIGGTIVFRQGVIALRVVDC